MVETLSNVGRLLLNGNQDVTGLVVETLLGRVVTDLLDGVSNDLLVVDLRPGGDLTEDHDHTGLGGGLTGDLRNTMSVEGPKMKHGVWMHTLEKGSSARQASRMASET